MTGRKAVVIASYFLVTGCLLLLAGILFYAAAYGYDGSPDGPDSTEERDRTE